MLLCAVTTFAQISEISELSNDKVYTFKSGRSNESKSHYLLYHTDAPDNLSSTYGSGHPMDYSDETTNFQFAVYNFNGAYYMFNIAAQKFVGNNDNNDGAIPLVENPTNSIEIRISANDTYKFLLSTNGTGALNCAGTQNCHGVVNWNGGYNNKTDGGNIYLITEVGDLSQDLKNLIESKLNVSIILNNAKTIVAGANDTRVGAYTTSAVAALSEKLEAYNAEQNTTNFEAVKTAYNELIANGEKVTLGANELFTLKCVEESRGYMVYSTIEGKGSETQPYLAATGWSNYHHSDINAEGIYKEWAITEFEGKKYLYNAEKKQFINSEGVVKFTDTPVAIEFISIENNLWEVQFEDNKRYLSFSPGWGANAVRTEGSIDNGCKFYIDKTGYEASIDAVQAVETTFVNGWKESVKSTLGFVGGYSTSLGTTIENISTLDGIEKFENENDYLPLTAGYYYIKKSAENKYATYNDNKAFIVENANLGIKHILSFVEDGDNFKLNVPNLGKNVRLDNADVNKGGASEIVDGGSNFTIETVSCGVVKIKGDGQVMRTEGTGEVNYWWGDTDVTWNIIPAVDVEVTINSLASICLPFAVGTPEGVTAYSIDETNSTHAILADKTDIPANEGAILAGNGTFKLNIIDAAKSDWSNNMLKGTTVTTEFTDNSKSYYILANGDNGIGLYPHDTEEYGNFVNNANKAYLAVDAAQGALSYGFTFGGTTAIEGIEATASEQAIYDLTGRKIDAITAPGLYIINGVKTIVE